LLSFLTIFPNWLSCCTSGKQGQIGEFYTRNIENLPNFEKAGIEKISYWKNHTQTWKGSAVPNIKLTVCFYLTRTHQVRFSSLSLSQRAARQATLTPVFTPQRIESAKN